MVRHRWWVVVLLAAVGAGAAYAVTSIRNNQIDPSFEATAPVAFVAEQEDTRSRGAGQGSNASPELADARDKAIELTSRYIDEGLGLVSIDERTSDILFSARAPQEARAVETAEAMRRAYLDGLETEARQARQVRLDEIVVEAADILAQIEALDPTEPLQATPDIDPDVLSRLQELNSLSNALVAQRTRAEVDLVLAEIGDDRVGTPEEIQAELDAVNERLAEVYAETATIASQYDLDLETLSGQQPKGSQTTQPPADTQQGRTPAPEEDPLSSTELADQWTIEALQERYNTLSEEYSSFFTDVGDAAEEDLAEVTVVDLAPEPFPPLLYAILGGLVGVLIAIGALHAQKRLRGLIYAPLDVAPIPVLAELPPVTVTTRRAESRMQRAAVQKRIDGIRRLRATLLAFSEEGDRAPAIGLAGVSVSGDQVRLLALDVAARVAASDRSVVLFDLDFDLEYAYRDSVSGVSVSALLSKVREDPAEGVKALEEALIDVTPGSGSCSVIRSGRTGEDPTDLVLTNGFRTLIDRARSHADLILVLLPDADDTLTKTVGRRFDGMIATAASGVSRKRALANVIPDASVGGDQAVGVALLTGRHASSGAVRRGLDDGEPLRTRLRSSRQPAFAGQGASPMEAEMDASVGAGTDASLGAGTDASLDAGPQPPPPPAPAATKAAARKSGRRHSATPPPADTASRTPSPEPPEPVWEPSAAEPSAVAERAPHMAPLETPAEPWQEALTLPDAPAEDPVAQPAGMGTVAESGADAKRSESRRGRVKHTLEKVETALEQVIALPGEVPLPPAPVLSSGSTSNGGKGRIGRALNRVETALERFIAPGEPAPSSGGWSTGLGSDRT